jgi:hypothetical protein
MEVESDKTALLVRFNLVDHSCPGTGIVYNIHYDNHYNYDNPGAGNEYNGYYSVYNGKTHYYCDDKNDRCRNRALVG